MDAPRTYNLRIQERTVEIEWLEIPTSKELAKILLEVTRNKKFRIGMGLLLIDRTTTPLPPPERVADLARQIADFAKHLDRHIAIAVDSEFHFEMARQITDEIERYGIIMTPFREVSTAQQWLDAQMSDSQFLPIAPKTPPPPTRPPKRPPATR